MARATALRRRQENKVSAYRGGCISRGSASARTRTEKEEKVQKRAVHAVWYENHAVLEKRRRFKVV